MPPHQKHPAPHHLQLEATELALDLCPFQVRDFHMRTPKALPMAGVLDRAAISNNRWAGQRSCVEPLRC
jgi:hypothetical protein